MVPVASEGDKRLLSNEHNNPRLGGPGRERCCVMVTANEDERCGTLESGEVYLSIAPSTAMVR